MNNLSKLLCEGMRYVVAALMVCAFSGAALRAEVLVIPVSGQGWQIKLEGPVLAVESQEINADGLTYWGSAGRFNVSAFVGAQPASGGDSKACRDHFWEQASQNPMIQKDSVKQWSTPNFECVEYVTVDKSEREELTRANTHCYFELLGKWVDVHASVITPTDEDTRMLKTLAESLMYCTFAESKGGRQEFVMGDMGSLKFDVPPVWRVGNHCVTTGIGTGEQHTLSLFTKNDPGKSWKMTFFNCAVRYKTQKDIEQMSQSARRPAAEGTVEESGQLEAIKMKQGVGCQTTYTEAAEADKPAQSGTAKVISSGFVAPLPNVLGMITISAGDAKDADFLAAIQALGSIEWSSDAAPKGKE